jgi:hypothetical protein
LATYLAYIDDSRDEKIACFSAIVIPALDWPQVLDDIIDFRRELKKSDGIRVKKELHASDFVAGRGDLGAIVTKARRAGIFEETLDFVASRPRLKILNACVPRACEEMAFERLIQRLQVHMEKKNTLYLEGPDAGRQPDPDAQVIVIVDQGKDYTGIVRRMRRHNYIASRYGSWYPSGAKAQNIPITRIVEDLVFRDSRQSALIQLADFCAFALLRFENPIASRTKYGLDKAFLRLERVLEKRAFGGDPRRLGIIRET